MLTRLPCRTSDAPSRSKTAFRSLLCRSLHAQAAHAGELGAEVGRVLGGGVRAGSLVLVGGGPGLGKSTLLIQLAALIGSAPPWQAQASSPLARTSERVLYISGEESEDQLAERAERLQVRCAAERCAGEVHFGLLSRRCRAGDSARST